MNETIRYDPDNPYDPDDPGQWPTVAGTAAWLTPQQAAKVKAMAALMHAGAEPDDRLDKIMSNDPAHRMFMYCLDAIARQAHGTHDDQNPGGPFSRRKPEA